MEAAPAQPFDVQVSGVLKGHGSEAETSVAHIPEEGIKIHFLGKGAGGRRLLRRPAPAADGIFPVVPGSAPAAGGVGDGGQGLQASRGIYQEIGVKAAEGMIAAGGHEAFYGNSRLAADVRHKLIQGIAVFFPGRFRTAAEIGYRLKVYAPDPGHQGGGQGDQFSQIPVVDAFDHRGNQGYAQPQIRADPDSPQLGLQEGSAPENFIDFIPGAVELKKDNVQPGLRQSRGIGGILRQPDAVGVYLHAAAAGFFGITHQIRQILPESGFASGELEQRLAALGDDLPDGGLQVFQRGIRCVSASVGKTVAAAEIAAVRHLQQSAAGAAVMLRADAAVCGTVCPGCWGQRLCSQKPPVKVHRPLPDQGLKRTVFRAGLFHKNSSVLPAAESRGQIPQAHRADGASLAKYHIFHSPIPKHSFLKTASSS